jgi:hypothetical protein
MAGQQYIGTGRLGAAQDVSYTGTAGVVANGVSIGVTKVRVLVTTDAFVTTDGTTPSANSGAYIPALSPEYLTVTPGQHVSAVQVSASGTLYVTELV